MAGAKSDASVGSQEHVVEEISEQSAPETPCARRRKQVDQGSSAMQQPIPRPLGSHFGVVLIQLFKYFGMSSVSQHELENEACGLTQSIVCLSFRSGDAEASEVKRTDERRTREYCILEDISRL